MTAALELARGGFEVHLIEREGRLGGALRGCATPIDGLAPQALLADLVGRVVADPRIQLHLRTQLTATTGFVGRFVSTLSGSDGSTFEVAHGVTIVASGAEEYRGPEFSLGRSPRVLTGSQMEALLRIAQVHDLPGFQLAEEDPATVEAWEALGGRLPREVAFVLCVGPAERYCGRTCCGSALRQALAVKERSPSTRVRVLYRELRTYGFQERLYRRAREAGVVFIRYEAEAPPIVETDGEELTVRTADPALDVELSLHPDLLVLSAPTVPRADARALATCLKVPVDAEGFFLEAHIKLRPVDFASDGIFLAGAAHYPKSVGETIVQAQAAAARAARFLSRPSLEVGGSVAQVDSARCAACLTCVRVCPFDVPRIDPQAVGAGGVQGAATIESSVCRGCGICVAECPAKAIRLAHFDDDQVLVKVEALEEAHPDG
jgi:heterodisulfide reductase subunit A-like polyferredoxin